MILTLTNQTELTCLDNSTSSELFFDYDKTTFLSLIDNFTYSNLHGAILENVDGETVLSTDCITYRKASNIEISNNIVKVTLSKLTSLERDILTLQQSVNDLLTALGDML